MRKAFNFFNSYYEVAKELNDKDRLSFLDALLKKQFTGCDTELTGMAKFAYLSQKHSIDSQIKGYFDKTRDPMFDPIQDPCQGGSVDPIQAPSLQEKEKGKEKVQDVTPFAERKKLFLDWFNNRILIHTGKTGKFKVLDKATENNLKKVLDVKYNNHELEYAFKNMYSNQWVKDNNALNPTHFLRIANLEKYMNMVDNSNIYIPNQELN
jgi:hypothetical protein